LKQLRFYAKTSLSIHTRPYTNACQNGLAANKTK